MKEKSLIIKKILILIYLFFLLSLITYIFSFYSISKGKVYDVFWIKKIQENLYWHGFIKSFPCNKHDPKLVYIPKVGKCSFKNTEFDTTLTFTKYFRENQNNIKFNENLSPIAVLGDSVSMGWGVDDNQTFSSILERNLKRKVYNFGVGGYGTHREILRFFNSPYYKLIDTIIIQYHMNDIDENYHFDEKKIYGKEYDFNSLMDINEMSGTKKALFALRRFKSSFRMLYREIKSIFYESEKPGFERHLNGILRILKKYNYLDGKKIIIFYVNSHNIKFKDYEVKSYKNIDFIDVNLIDKKHYFVLDDHPNVDGHAELANQLTKIITTKNW